MAMGLHDLAPGENILWRNIKKHLWFGHTTQIMEITEKSIVLWRETKTKTESYKEKIKENTGRNMSQV